MAVQNRLTNNLGSIIQNAQNRQQLQNMASETLFGLLSDQSDRNIIADNQFLFLLTDLQNRGLNIEQEITDKQSAVTQRFNYPNTTNPCLPNIQYNTNTSNDTANTLQRLQAEETRLNFQQNNSRNTIDSLRNALNQIRGNAAQDQTNRQNLQAQITQQQQSLDQIATDLAEIQRVLPLFQDLLNLQRIQNATQNSIGTRTNPNQGTRHHELQSIIHIMQNLFRINQTNYIPQLGAQTLNHGGSINHQNNNTIDLDSIFVNNAQNTGISYALCNNNTGEELAQENGKRIIQTANGQNIQIAGLQIINNQLSGQNIQIEPLDSIQFPVTIEIAVRGRIQESNTGINIDNYKSLTLTINAPTLAQNDRETAYDNLNTALGNNTIQNRITSTYNANNENRENEVIREILRSGGNTQEVENIYNDPNKRDLLLERLRGIPNLVPVLSIQNLITGFRTNMTDPNKQIPAQHLTNINTFSDYLRQNIDQNIEKYLKKQVKQSIEGNRINNGVNNRDRVIATFMQFATDIANNKLDSDDHMQILQNLVNEEPQGHPNTLWQRITGRRSNKNNYTKFFAGKEQTVDNQSLETENGEFKYSINLRVESVNKMTATIQIEGEDEPLIIDAANHTQLIQGILAREATKFGEPLHRKARCHMAISTIKALVQMAPTALHREFNGVQTAINGQQYNVDRVEAFVRNGNLTLRANCATAHGNRMRVNQVIFDENRYKNMQNVDELENGVNQLSQQIGGIMNSMADEFRTATSRIKPGPLMSYNTNLPLRFGRAKRLYGRLAHGKTNYNFDFTTSANAGGKAVQIKFEKEQFILSGTHHDKPYEFKGKNLGKLLRTRRERVRVFDGVELEIINKVNEAMVEKLRTNTFIRGENFAVADVNENKTGRIYILDSTGHLSYLEIEDRNLSPLRGKQFGKIPENQLPPQRIRCNEQERKDFMQNPLLGGKLLRTMRLQLALF